MRSRLADFGRGLVALAALMSLVLGIPVALTVAVGWPLPAAVPSANEVGEALTRRGVDDAVVVKTLAILLWLVWVQIVVALLVEMAALVRGRAPTRAPTLPAAQVLVAKLVAATALIASVAASPRGEVAVAPHPMVPVALVSQPAAAPLPPPVISPAPTERAPQATATYTVQRHDSLWSIAERVLGDGFRWRELRDANVGQTMPDGTTIGPATETIEPGWVLRLPDDAVTAPASAPPSTEQVVVVPGDHLWSIAEETLAAELGREPTDVEVRPHWQRIIDANRTHLADPSNPSLIFAGQSIVIPDDPDSLQTEAASTPAVPLPSVDASAPPTVPKTTAPRTSAPSTTAIARPTELDVADQADVDSATEASQPTGLFGVAGAAIAVGVGAELMRRRRRRLLRVPPGRMPPTPPPELDDLRRDLVLGGDEDAIAMVNRAARELAASAAHSNSSARLRLLQIEGHHVEALMTSTVLPPPGGWRADGGGTVLLRDAAGSPSVVDDGPAPGVLVAVGARDEGGQLYLDLEAEPGVSVVGQPDATREFIASMVVELSNSPVSDVQVVVVGFDELEPLEACDDLRVEREWDDIADDVLARAERSHDLMAANRWPNAFAARGKSGWRDDLVPLVVFLADAPSDERFDRVCDLISTGMTTVSLVIGAATPGLSRIELDGDLLRLTSAGIACRAQGVVPETVKRVVDVLTDSDYLPEQLPFLDEVTQPSSLADTVTEEEPEVLVRVLGEIEVVGGRRPLTPKQTAVVTYIALHAPVTAERIEDAIWTEPTSSRRKRMSNTVSDCRFSLGEEHLPLAHEGRYTVGPKVATDIALFERRVAFSAERPPEGAVQLLREALDLVRGPVFTYRSLDRASYVWVDIENWMTTWELKVADAAIRLSELALELGDPATAVWAAERGLLALPTNSPLTEALMKAYRAQGDNDAAERVYDRHVAALQELGIDDVAETTIDLREQTSPRQRASSA